uniref:Uncharacterized protein n=1 Tax=Falco tinnunculus TaxID=100819 RepID=A0A8C4XKF6_FALTI
MLCVFLHFMEHLRPQEQNNYFYVISNPLIFLRTTLQTLPKRFLNTLLKTAALFSSCRSTKPSRPSTLIPTSHSLASC